MRRAVALLTALAGLAPAQDARPAVFTFQNGFWINLHHFLYVLGRAKNQEPDSRRAAVVKAPGDDGGLNADEREIWDATVTAYARSLSKKDAVFDAELVGVSRAVAAGELPESVRETLERAAPVYRRAWWPRHSAANDARIGDLKKALAQYGDRVSAIVTRAYHQQWPEQGITVEVVAYSNWAGAYSTDGGLIVFSSLDDSTTGPAGMEIVFHEAMHQWDDAIIPRLKGARRGLSHALIFYTAGHAVSQVVDGYRPYATSMWGTGAMPPKSVMDREWLPYLKGERTIDEAIAGLAAAWR
jgi:hypothetical protein